jgi:hypothetical protein
LSTLRSGSRKSPHLTHQTKFLARAITPGNFAKSDVPTAKNQTSKQNDIRGRLALPDVALSSRILE